MAKKISLTFGQFSMMSETHLKYLVSQGMEVVIEDNAQPKVVNTTSNYTVAKATDNKTSSLKKSNTKPAAKAANNKKSTASKGSNETLAFGKVKAKQHFACYNLKDKNNPVLAKVGYAVKVDNKAKIVYAVYGKNDKKGFALENCVAITKQKYDKLKSKFGVKTDSKSNPKVSTSTKLTATDYKAVYAFNLKKLGKITDEEFAKANSDPAVATELYKKFSSEVKLLNADALKLFAEEVKSSSAKVN